MDQLLLKEEKIDNFGLVSAELAGDGKLRRTALVEIAGRDSIAAGLLAANSGKYDVLIPTIVYTGSEYGDWKGELENSRAFASYLRDSCGIDAPRDPLLLGSPGWFHAVAGRFTAELYDIYGFSTICIACHMYCHAVRIPLAKEAGATAVISGGRIEHDGRIKVNQLGVALKAYADVLGDEGVLLEFPLRDVSRGREVQEIIGTVPGINVEPSLQIDCVLESNYRDHEGRVNCPAESLEAYLHKFLVPATRQILRSVAAGEKPVDYVGIARDILAP